MNTDTIFYCFSVFKIKALVWNIRHLFRSADKARFQFTDRSLCEFLPPASWECAWMHLFIFYFIFLLLRRHFGMNYRIFEKYFYLKKQFFLTTPTKGDRTVAGNVNFQDILRFLWKTWLHKRCVMYYIFNLNKLLKNPNNSTIGFQQSKIGHQRLDI